MFTTIYRLATVWLGETYKWCRIQIQMQVL